MNITAVNLSREPYYVTAPYTLAAWAEAKDEIIVDLWEDRQGNSYWVLRAPSTTLDSFARQLYTRLHNNCEMLRSESVQVRRIIIIKRYPLALEGDYEKEWNDEADDFCEIEDYG